MEQHLYEAKCTLCNIVVKLACGQPIKEEELKKLALRMKCQACLKKELEFKR